MTIQSELIETEIQECRRQLDYSTIDYPLEAVCQKYFEGMLSFPKDYQKNYWDRVHQSNFIEFLLLGLPISYITTLEHLQDDDEVHLEVIDGVQRLHSIISFVSDQLELTALARLTSLNGFKFSDLLPYRQRKFKRVTLRIVQFVQSSSRELLAQN